MTPSQSIKTCLKKILTYKGRACRSEFWYYFIVCQLIWWVFKVAELILAQYAPQSVVDGHTAPMGIWQFSQQLVCILNLLTCMALLTVAIRRLHDLNIHGWWFAGYLFLAAVLSAMDWIHQSGQPLYSINTAFILHMVVDIAVCILFLFPGTDGENRFGPDPLAGQTPAKDYNPLEGLNVEGSKGVSMFGKSEAPEPANDIPRTAVSSVPVREEHAPAPKPAEPPVSRPAPEPRPEPAAKPEPKPEPASKPAAAAKPADRPAARPAPAPKAAATAKPKSAATTKPKTSGTARTRTGSTAGAKAGDTDKK